MLRKVVVAAAFVHDVAGIKMLLKDSSDSSSCCSGKKEEEKKQESGSAGTPPQQPSAPPKSPSPQIPAESKEKAKPKEESSAGEKLSREAVIQRSKANEQDVRASYPDAADAAIMQKSIGRIQTSREALESAQAKNVDRVLHSLSGTAEREKLYADHRGVVNELTANFRSQEKDAQQYHLKEIGKMVKPKAPLNDRKDFLLAAWEIAVTSPDTAERSWKTAMQDLYDNHNAIDKQKYKSPDDVEKVIRSASESVKEGIRIARLVKLTEHLSKAEMRNTNAVAAAFKQAVTDPSLLRGSERALDKEEKRVCKVREPRNILANLKEELGGKIEVLPWTFALPSKERAHMPQIENWAQATAHDWHSELGSLDLGKIGTRKNPWLITAEELKKILEVVNTEQTILSLERILSSLVDAPKLVSDEDMNEKIGSERDPEKKAELKDNFNNERRKKLYDIAKCHAGLLPDSKIDLAGEKPLQEPYSRGDMRDDVRILSDTIHDEKFAHDKLRFELRSRQLQYHKETANKGMDFQDVHDAIEKFQTKVLAVSKVVTDLGPMHREMFITPTIEELEHEIKEQKTSQ